MSELKALKRAKTLTEEQILIVNLNDKTLPISINGKIFEFKKGDKVFCSAGEGEIIILNN